MGRKARRGWEGKREERKGKGGCGCVGRGVKESVGRGKGAGEEVKESVGGGGGE
jgi:hypothetical protein